MIKIVIGNNENNRWLVMIANFIVLVINKENNQWVALMEVPSLLTLKKITRISNQLYCLHKHCMNNSLKIFYPL
jgi:hypothetical protein